MQLRPSISPLSPYTTLFRSNIPENALVSICGVSGSGKSSLMQEAFPESYPETIMVGQGSIGIRSEEQRLNSSHVAISYAVFCLKKKKTSITKKSVVNEE